MTHQSREEKKPKRPHRWTREPWEQLGVFAQSQSAWRRGSVLVLSSLERSPVDGDQWRISISQGRNPPSDNVCLEVLREFDAEGLAECLNAPGQTLSAIGRSAHARHFQLSLPMN